MSDSNGTCEYVLDPDDPETWGEEEGDVCHINHQVLNHDGVWSCPHETFKNVNGDDLCIFHTPIKQKSDKKVLNKFISVLESAKKGDSINFLNSKFRKFNIQSKLESVEMPADATIDFSYSHYHGPVNLTGMVIRAGEIRFYGGEFNHSIKAIETKFHSNVNFRDANINSIDFTGSEFNQSVSFEGTTFENTVDFHATKFYNTAEFNDCKFCGNVDFIGAIFHKASSFDTTEFVYNRNVNFYGVNFKGGTTFQNSFLSGVNFRKGNLTEVNFKNSDLTFSQFEGTILSRAALFRTDLRGAKLSGAVLGDVRIDKETQFLGHPDDDSDSSPHTYSAIRSQPRCVYDPKYVDNNDDADVDKAKSVYRALEELAGKAARTRLQSQCFVRRQDLQKDGYKRVMLGDTEAPEGEKEDSENKEENIENEEENPSLEERLIAGARYSRAKVARTTLLYGESPWRIIGISSLFILAVGLVYPIFGWVQPREDSNPITWTRILDGEPILLLESIYFSALTFTTLGMGDYAPIGGGGQALATINTAFGAILIALLVFVFGRRAAR